MRKIIPGKWGYLIFDLAGPYSPPYLTWSGKAKMGKIWTSYHPSMHGEDQRGVVYGFVIGIRSVIGRWEMGKEGKGKQQC